MPPAGGEDRKRRALVVANPHATTVSYRLKNLVLYALGSRYEVEAVDTEGRNHAIGLCRAAAPSLPTSCETVSTKQLLSPEGEIPQEAFLALLELDGRRR